MLTKRIKLYENREDVTLTTYVLDDSKEMLDGKKRPAVLICPGGAYLNCSDREAEPIALKFASMGYHAFVLRYSVYFEGEDVDIMQDIELVKKEHCMYPNPMREIGKAMLIINENSEKWKVDTKKIALCGFSAGAHNVSMYSVYWNKPVIQDYFNEEAIKLKPAVTILGYVLSDYYIMKKSINDKWAKKLFDLSYLAYTGDTEVDEETMKKVSPALNVNEDTPPMFLWSTYGDTLVPVENTLDMASALTRKDIPNEVHIFEEGDHGLSLASQASAMSKSQINEDVANWILLVKKWLNKRFSLKLPKKGPWEG